MMTNITVNMEFCKTINALAYFEFNVNKETFVKLFLKYSDDKELAEHLWNKFHEYNHSILKLVGSADLETLKILANAIEEGIQKYMEMK